MYSNARLQAFSSLSGVYLSASFSRPMQDLYDNEQIRADFNELYQQMNGMPLREMDNIVYPVCKLCRDHEKAGFIEGIRIGVLLAQEVTP